MIGIAHGASPRAVLLRIFLAVLLPSVCITSEETMESMVDETMLRMGEEAENYWKRGMIGEALKVYERMADYRPRHADSHFNVGLTKNAIGDLEGSMEAIERALRLPSGVPHHSAYHQQMGTSACKLAERRNDHVLWDKCLRHISQSIHIQPVNSLAWMTAATNYMALGYEKTAIRATETARRLGVSDGSALSEMGINFMRVGRHDEAITCLEKALAVNRNLHRTEVELLHTTNAVADWRNYNSLVDRVRLITKQQLARGEYTDLQPFDALALPYDSDMLLGIAKAYAMDAIRNTDQTMAFRHLHHESQLSSDGRIHVGYVSADWTDKSAVGRALRGGFEHHNRERVLVTCYTLRNQKAVHDPAARSLSSLVERVVALNQVTDLGSAQTINKDGVHILANLNGYTSSARTELFAYHPAPIQILLQGFAGTAGASFLQYTLVDKVQSPPEQAEFYSEKMQILPVSAFRGEGTGHEPILSATDRAEARVRIKLPARSFVAANLNRPFKLEPRIFENWMGFLNQTNDSYIWMFNWPEALSARRHMRKAAGQDLSKRLIFTDLLPIDQRIAGKTVADLFLDTPEYNAHGTATEVLSSGVPVLTLPGAKAHSSRVAASVVLALGMPELVARNIEEYQEIAIKLAQRPQEMRLIRERLSTASK